MDSCKLLTGIKIWENPWRFGTTTIYKVLRLQQVLGYIYFSKPKIGQAQDAAKRTVRSDNVTFVIPLGGEKFRFYFPKDCYPTAHTGTTGTLVLLPT